MPNLFAFWLNPIHRHPVDFQSLAIGNKQVLFAVDDPRLHHVTLLRRHGDGHISGLDLKPLAVDEIGGAVWNASRCSPGDIGGSVWKMTSKNSWCGSSGLRA